MKPLTRRDFLRASATGTAQQFRPDQTVAVAAYGDGGPWYIPTREEYPKGGYESEHAFCSDEVDELLTDAMQHLLT